ncbi:hypothetical protein B0H13DRAFT_2342598 [Mycena leptocephala]|nr:hypothetical protein B0H13DRAFT_2342598 [Mycena leptocephala]
MEALIFRIYTIAYITVLGFHALCLIHLQSAKTLKDGEELSSRFDTALVKDGTSQITGAADVGLLGGQTPLHLAAETGLTEIIRLLDRGADINAPNDDGWTPLQLAREAQMSTLAEGPVGLLSMQPL